MSAYCQLCGNKIEGRGHTFRHPRWSPELVLRVCDACLQDKPRCRECDLPIAAQFANTGLCTTCSQTLRCCLACGQPVKGAYYEFDGIGPYCKTCFNTRPPCDLCGAPLTNESWQLSDGRVVCAHCHGTAIYAPKQASAIYEDMKAVIATRLALALNVPTGLALVDRNGISQVITHQGQAAGSNEILHLDPTRTLGLYARRGMRRGIYIQTGLPRVLFLQVAAHEFAHAWQGENCPVWKDANWHEGFAEWLAYRVLGFYGYSRAQSRMLSRSDLYGQSLRWALELETRSGLPGLMDACRSPERS